MRILKNLQQKPEAVRKSIMWIGIISIMTVIFAFWVFSFPSQIPESEETEATTNLKKELPSVWQSLKNQINNIKNIWQNQDQK